MPKAKVAAGMSKGVDSSVAAYLLKEQGAWLLCYLFGRSEDRQAESEHYDRDSGFKIS